MAGEGEQGEQVRDHETDEEQEEDPGNDFLKLKKVNKFTAAHKIQIYNVLNHHGGFKPSRGSPEWTKMLLDEYYNLLIFASVLCGNDTNELWNIACCIDVETIRNYDIAAKNYKLPPCQVGKLDASTLQGMMSNHVASEYARFEEKEEEAFKQLHPKATYMQTTHYEVVLQPLLGQITRYHIHFWYIHKHLNRRQAYEEGKKVLEEKFKKRGDAKKIIDEMIQDLKFEGTKKQLLALETETQQETMTVFKENESAQVIIAQFLAMRNSKIPKDCIDNLLALQDYIKELPDDEKPEFQKFVGMQPKQTLAYLKKVQDKKDKEEAKKRREEQAKKKEEDKKLKKKRKLEEAKQKIIQKSPGDVDELLAEDEVDKDEEDANKEATELIDKVLMEDNAEYKLPYHSYKIVTQRECSRNKCTQSKRRLTRSDKMDDHAGIKKHIQSMTEDGSVVVEYTEPGNVWKMQVASRLRHIVNGVNVWCAEYEEDLSIMEYYPPEEYDGTITQEIGRVVIAVMMHVACNDRKQMKDCYLFAHYHEPNVLEDLLATRHYWLPTIMMGSLLQIYTFYELSQSLEDDPDGSARKARRAKILQILQENPDKFTKETASVIEEVMGILYTIDWQLGKATVVAPEGKSTAMDPFKTTIGIYDN